MSPPLVLPLLVAVLGGGADGLAQQPPDPVVVDPATRLEAPGAGAFSALGESVALDGDLLASGLFGDPDTGLEGAVHLFARTRAGWSPSARMQAAGVPPAEQHYTAVDLDGDTLVASGTALGVHVFVRAGENWTEQAVLPRVAGEGFGQCVALDGDTAVVGAPWADAAAGAAYVFVRAGTTWTQQARLTAADPHPDDNLGWSASLDGDRLALGARKADGVAADTGAAYLFVRSGTTWTQEAKLVDPTGTGTPSDSFGIAVSMPGDRVAVGADADDVAGPNAGSVLVFARGPGGWAPEYFLLPLDPSPNAGYGTALALHGDRLLIGAPRQVPPGATASAGAGYLLERTGVLWRQRATLRAAGGVSGALGTGLDLDGRHVALGAPSYNGTATFSGALHVYPLRSIPATFCAGKTSSLGCVPFVEVEGRPSVDAGELWLRARDALPGEHAFLVYGTHAASLPFHGGTLCVKAPRTRWLPPVKAGAGGSGPCSGVLALDFTARVRSGADPALTLGRTVVAQWIQRDPGDPAGSGDALTNAARFTLGP